MATMERAVDRGARMGRAALVRLGAELRGARIDHGLSIDFVAAAVGLSNAEVSRIERALSPNVPFVTLARLAAIVGLDLAARFYPGPGPARDAAHAQLLADFHGELHPSLRWAVEVPLPITGDQRAWDGMVAGEGWRYGIEAESAPRDAQALIRRLHLKERDGEVDGVLLIVRGTRRVREFMREAADELHAAFPTKGSIALERLRTGLDPGGSAVILIPGRRRPSLG